MKDNKNMVLGWKEYAALPDLGVDKIHVKVDTGAKTSAIHTIESKLFKKNNESWVRFIIAPYQNDNDTKLTCELPVKDQRTVTSSNGQKTERIVIETTLVIGQIERTIEITLVCRKKMKFRMLLGRQAMRGMTIKPTKSHLTHLK